MAPESPRVRWQLVLILCFCVVTPMVDAGKLAEYLVGSGILRTEQFEEAKQCVSGQKLTLDRALLVLKFVDYSQLGECYSGIFKLPYMPVLPGRPPEEVRRLLSAEFARAWKVFPWAYDQYENVLTVAVHDPEQIPLLERVSRFFMQPYTMAFTIASQAEIEEALAIHCGGGPASNGGSGTDLTARGRTTGAAPRPAEQGERKKIQLLDHTKSLQKPSGAPKGKEAVPAPRGNGRAADAGPMPDTASAERSSEVAEVPAQEFAYASMRGVLRSAAALAVRAYLAKNPARLEEICSRVRYCELISSRLTMSIVQSDAVVLAAWLSGMEDEKHVLQQLVTPYKLEELLSCGTRSEGGDRIEARILSLVKCFQELTRSDPNAVKDVGLMRRFLRREWSSSPVRQNMLETFLQVLMDEQFVDKLDRADGRILIVDPSEGPTSVMAAPLVRYGYEVQTVATAAAADDILQRFDPDVILCERDLPGGNGIAFCEKVKGTPKTSHVRVIVLSRKSGKEYAAESLRAGADDFLQKPVNLEVLFLKIRQLMTVAAGAEEREGIRGLLGEMNFSDMIQILSAGGKSKEIVLSSGGRQGSVFVVNGEVIHASVGESTGETAFYELMRWTDGEFMMKQCVKFPERSINVPVVSLLMRGAKIIDEKIAEAGEPASVHSTAQTGEISPTPPPSAG